MAPERPAVITELAPAAALCADGAGLSLLVRTFGPPVGPAGDGRRLALANTPMLSEGCPEGCLCQKRNVPGGATPCRESLRRHGAAPP
jgi:hypothetical protein